MFKPKFNNDWSVVLADELEKPYFIRLCEEVSAEYSQQVCYPPMEQIFAAFNECSFENIKVVIIGQDPYHGTNEANGLSFSVNDGIAIPPSLRNIYKELINDYEKVLLPSSGNLQSWAKQGVFLLNAVLTVQKDKPNSHQKIGWSQFTSAVIELISINNEKVVFLLWGAFAQKKGAKIDPTKHLILTSGHPSPMSANQGKWFGNKHFSKTNDYLTANNKKSIEWFDI